MRVVIDFDGARAGRWAGSVHADGDAEASPFDGRLDLLRQLEALVDHATSHHPFTERNQR